MLGPDTVEINREIIIRSPSDNGGDSALSHLQKIFRVPNAEFDSVTGFHRGPIRRKGRSKVLWSWTASVIDSCLLLAGSCIFVLVSSKILGAPVSVLLTDLRGTASSLQVIGVILLVASWFYMVLCRSLFGASIGEAMCDLRLGAPRDEEKPQFIFKVILRASLILLTGVITLPLGSFITGQDLAGQICGLRLFSLK